MSTTTARELEAAWLDIHEVLENSQAVRQEYEAKFERIRESFNPQAIDRCLGTFISSELDFTTAGDCGLGRISVEIPRFGAYYRPDLMRLPHEALVEFETSLKSITLRGYVFAMLFFKNFSPATGHVDKDALFDAWVPMIYSAPPPDKIAAPLMSAAEAAVARVKALLNSHRFAAGALPGNGKIDVILFHYAWAGYILRYAESKL